jgi:hypothetical protein
MLEVQEIKETGKKKAALQAGKATRTLAVWREVTRIARLLINDRLFSKQHFDKGRSQGDKNYESKKALSILLFRSCGNCFWQTHNEPRNFRFVGECSLRSIKQIFLQQVGFSKPRAEKA